MTVSSKTLNELGISFVRESHGIGEFKLDASGLKILLIENHAAPVVTAMVVYRVGSRNEGVGHTGSTHFLEHMMFKSTEAFDHSKGHGIDDLLKPIGAAYNASTSNDRTNYFECVPKQNLALCLAIEADRMRNLRLKESDRQSEMTVVRSEFEMGENSADEALDKQLMAMAFRAHPYHHPTIGWRKDVEGVPLEKLQSFYDVFYWPNNATLIIVGDFDPSEALKLVNDSFGKIPHCPHTIPSVYTTEPEQEGLRRFEIRRAGGDLARVMLGFKVPPASHPDYHALCVIRDILGNSDRKSSRLCRNIDDNGLATSVYAVMPQSKDPDLFKVGAVVAEDKTPQEVEAALIKELQKLAARAVTETELTRAKTSNRNSTASLKDDPIEFAEQLCEAEAVADWTLLVDYDDRYDAVTTDDIKRVAKAYFVAEHLTVGTFLPVDASAPAESTHDEADKPAAGEDSESDVESDDTQSVPAAKDTVDTPPQTSTDDAPLPCLVPDKGMNFQDKVTRKVLANGLTLLLMKAEGTGVVSVSGAIKAGNYCNPDKKTMLSSVTADMLLAGSKSYSKTALSETLENLGTSLDINATDFHASFDSTMMAASLPSYLGVLRDVLIEPAFSDEELKKLKRELTADLKEGSSDTAKVARVRLMKALYPADHVYHHKSFSALIKELRTIELSDVQAFFAEHYSPKGTVLALVGDFDVAQVIELVEKAFADWTGKEPKPVVVSPVELPKESKRITVPMKDKASVDILIGLPSPVKRTAADYFACRIANAALGQDTLGSRLGVEVREKNGLTYGITSSFDDPSYGFAPWMIELSVNPANVDKALKLVDEVVERYRREGITARELADETSRTYGATVVGLRTTHAIASTIVWLESIGLSVAALDTLHTELKAVTKEAVNKAIREYLRMDRAVTVLVGTVGK
jgi:zinc protease